MTMVTDSQVNFNTNTVNGDCRQGLWCIEEVMQFQRYEACSTPPVPSSHQPPPAAQVLLEAQDALARNAMQTPLRGEDNADVTGPASLLVDEGGFRSA